MSDVSKIFGPAGKPQPNIELKSTVSPEEFKKMMQQVQKTDPDEEKKRKQEEEETEEAPPEPVATEPEYTEPIEGPSFLDVQKTSTPSFQSSETLSLEGREGYTPSAPSVYTPQISENEELESSISPPVGNSQFSSSYAEKAPAVTPSSSTTLNQTPSTERSSEVEKKEKKHAIVTGPPVIDPLVFSASSKPTPHAIEAAKPAPSLAELISMIPPEAPLQELPPESIVPEEKIAAMPPLHGILGAPKIEGPEVKQKVKGAEEDLSLFDPSLSDLHAPLIAPPSEIGPNDPFARLPAAIQELFTRMVGVMTVMNLTPGVTETTFILNSPQFASSVFFGSQIIIKEFSTAPQVFNIQLNGSQQATNMFQSNLPNLAAALQEGSPNFKVNRLETGYLEETERPLFHRKDGESQEQDFR